MQLEQLTASSRACALPRPRQDRGDAVAVGAVSRCQDPPETPGQHPGTPPQKPFAAMAPPGLPRLMLRSDLLGLRGQQRHLGTR